MGPRTIYLPKKKRFEEPPQKRQRVEEQPVELPPPGSMHMDDEVNQGSSVGPQGDITTDDELFRAVGTVVSMSKDDPQRAEMVCKIDQYLSGSIGQPCTDESGNEPMGMDDANSLGI